MTRQEKDAVAKLAVQYFDCVVAKSAPVTKSNLLATAGLSKDQTALLRKALKSVDICHKALRN